MMYAGEMELPSLVGYEVFADQVFESPYDLYEGSLKFLQNVQSLCIGLLPHDLDIELTAIQCGEDTEQFDDKHEKVSKLRHLILLLRENGQNKFLNFQFSILNTNIQVHYNEKNELILICLKDGENNLCLHMRHFLWLFKSLGSWRTSLSRLGVSFMKLLTAQEYRLISTKRVRA